MDPQCPPKPYARVRLTGSDPSTSYDVRCVPLHWLQDSRLATQSHVHIREHYEPPVGALIFQCFYSPVGYHVQPAFHAGIRRGVREEWANAPMADGAALFQVHVLNVVLENRHEHVQHATVRLVTDRTELTVPVSWLQYPHMLHTKGNGQVVDPFRALWCYYEPVDMGGPYSMGHTVKRLNHFREGVRAWYEVNVVHVFEARTLDVPSDDDSVNDNGSTLSLDVANNANGGSVGDESADEVQSAAERGEEKLLQALENAGEKSVQTRTAALATIAEVLSQRYLPDCVEDRKITIMDVIERSLRRGKGVEQALAAQLVPILVLQLGDADIVAQALGQLLLQTAQNRSASNAARARSCAALSLLSVLAGSDVGDALLQMQAMEAIFAGSYLKGDKSQSSATPEEGQLHCAALSAWALLLTLFPAGDFCMLMNSGSPGMPEFKNLLGLLQSPHLDVRMSAGETIALMLETGRTHDADFLDEYLPALVDTTRQLATDSQKFRAKRDRKTQRATFRDVLRYVEEDQMPESTIRFGSGEKLALDSWAEHAMYASLVGAMGPGMTSHLAENDFLRDVLELGPRQVETGRFDVNRKRNRQQRHLMNAAAFKERTRLRAIDRNKKGHF